MPKAPKAPDPVATAQAQAGMNRDTALTQQGINMVNQYTDDGSLEYNQDGFTEFTDSQGNVIQTPRYSATTTLSPQQKAIKDQTDAASLNLGTIANDQSAFLQDYLKGGVNTSGVPGLQGSIFGLRSSIGGGYSGNVGGSFSDTLGSGYNSSFSGDIGGSYRDTLGDGYATSYAGADDFSADRQRYEDAIRTRMEPDLTANRDNLRNTLIAQGLRPGTAAWDSEMDRLSRSENDAQISAILAGGQEQSRMVGLARDAAVFGNDAITNRFQLENNASMGRAQFGQNAQQLQNEAEANRFGMQNAAALSAAGLRNDAALGEATFGNNAATTAANFNNAARSQGMSEAYAARSQPINEISALLSGAQVQNPNFVSTPTTGVGGVDYTGLVNNQYQSQVASRNSAMGGLFGLLSAPFSFTSDRRAKENIVRLGTLANGLPWYAFRYFWDADTAPLRQGVMSDEVRKIMPHAVGIGANGFDYVNYDLILEAA